MATNGIQDLLPLVERPSRYLGSEVNTIRKDPSKAKLKFALAFPDLYEIGTSHFGLQILYKILNHHTDTLAERVFTPAEDMAVLLRRSGVSLTSLENRIALKDFDILGFSLLYELNYTNILTILDLAAIPFLARERDDSHPLVIGGGPCTCNPEPLADFFDMFVIGDGEEVVLDLAETWLELKNKGIEDKSSILEAWSRIKGVYIPEFYPMQFDQNGFQHPDPNPGIAGHRPQRVERAVLTDLDGASFPRSPIIPFGKPVHDRLRLEISRGCTRGCRFCQAGMIYRPVRERSQTMLMKLCEESLKKTGYEDISLLSLSTGDYSCIAPLVEGLMARHQSGHTAVSLPSLRAGTLTQELMAHIKKVRKTGFTIAPEAGTQRLRNVINKNITRDEIVDTVTNAFSMGWQVIKLYFMIGLPTETEADIQGIVDLVEELRKIKGHRGRPGKLNVSVTTFIPKPHTPFQWHPQISKTESKEKIDWLRSKLKRPGIHFKWQNPEVSYLEGIWARGDRRLSRLLLSAYQKGCRFDGWSDHFNYRLWENACEETEIDTHFFTTRKRDLDEPLPWDHLDMKVEKGFLKQEWESALEGLKTEDCRWNPCNNCGVCDFESVQPHVFEPGETRVAEKKEPHEKRSGFNKIIRVVYAKTGMARFFGHLEMANIIVRAIRRAGIPVQYSQGFHPMPKISFEDPLPIGMQSLGERMYLTVPDYVGCKEVMALLKRELPEGLELKACSLTGKKKKQGDRTPEQYHIQLKEGFFDKTYLEHFKTLSEHPYFRINKKGKRKSFDLKEMIKEIRRIDSKQLMMQIRNKEGQTLRPSEILSEIFKLSSDEIRQAIVIKGIENNV